MMNYTGLYTPYKLNRPLTENERNGQFCQGKRRRVNAIMDESSVIRMNSTCLDTVCKYYCGTGISSSMIGVLILGVLFAFIYEGIYVSLSGDDYVSWGGVAFSALVMALFIMLLSKLLLKEWFRKTHYPIRFNRKNQMVYVYQVNGECFLFRGTRYFLPPPVPGGLCRNGESTDICWRMMAKPW
ncbi:hypothetical protein ACI0Z1_002235 [Cronobacter malonaticus]